MHLRRSAAGASSMVLWFAALAALPLLKNLIMFKCEAFSDISPIFHMR